MKKHKKGKKKKGNTTTHFTLTIPLATMPLKRIHIEEGVQDKDIWNITPFQMYMVSKFLPEEENKE